MSFQVKNRAKKLYVSDSIGNRVSSEDSGQTTEYQANQLNQYSQTTSSSATNNFSFDADGNMLTNGDWTYAWNGENRLISASNGTTVVTMTYDFRGRRFSKVVDGDETKFIYNGWNAIQETSSSATNHYTWGLDLRYSIQRAGGVGGLLSVTEADGETYLTAFDANGNITDYVSDDGTIVARYVFDPFGNTISSSGTKADDFVYRFSTKPLDKTGLYYYNFRYYEPNNAKWLRRDPIGERGGINRYAYVWNAPLNWIDELGLQGAVDWDWGPWGSGFGPYPTTAFDNADDAAKAAGEEWLPLTQEDPDQIEYCGLVCEKCGKYQTTVNRGKLDDDGSQQCNPHGAPCPSGWSAVSWWHTQGLDNPTPWWNFWSSQLESEWSDDDTRYSEYEGWENGEMPGYLTNPDGTGRYDPEPGGGENGSFTELN